MGKKWKDNMEIDIILIQTFIIFISKLFAQHMNKYIIMNSWNVYL